jgi:cytochrome oxidase Cu insertion factor (SCO1/SenC/PrrC family)
MSRKLPIAVVALIALVFVAGAWLNLSQDEPPENTPVGGMVVNVDIGGPFTLTDHTGTPFGSTELAGNYALVYFGYTFCPDICPTELGQIAEAIDILGPEGDRVRPVMITIDPERDTSEVLSEYVPLFHERLVGLTGTEAEVRDVATNYRVFYKRFEDPSYTYYLMDHTSFVYLLAPTGEIASMFRYGTPPEDIAATIRQHMQRPAQG